MRVNVTSPGGTTAAALAVLMDPETGFPSLLNRAVARRRRPWEGAGEVTDALISFDDFLKVDIRVGRDRRVPSPSPKRASRRSSCASISAPSLGEKKSSAQITRHYRPEDLIGRQVLAVVNFPPRQIGKFMSEVLVLGVPDAEGEVVLLRPDLRCRPAAGCTDAGSGTRNRGRAASVALAIVLTGGKPMNWDRVEGNWKQMKGSVKEQWGKLTDDDLDVAAGKRDKLVGRVQERYGKAKDEAEREVDSYFSKLS